MELLIAAAILSAGIIFILQALSYSSRVAGISGDLLEAVFLSRSKLQELGFKEKYALLNQGPLEESGIQDKFRWQYSLNFDPDLKLYKLDFKVNWMRAKREETLGLMSYLRE